MGGTPCRLKIIMNGARVALLSDVLGSHVSEEGVEIDDDYGYKIAEHLNAAEDSVNKATHAFLESQGYHGPYDHSLNFEE